MLCMHAHSAAISSWIPNDRQPDDIMIAIDPAEAHKPYNGRRSIYATRSMNVPKLCTNTLQARERGSEGVDSIEFRVIMG